MTLDETMPSSDAPLVRRVLAPSALLVGLNILLMYLVAVTPLAAANRYLFSIPFVGVIVYGAVLYLGESVAERGLRNGGLGTAAIGVGILQIAYGLFGGGVLSYAPRDLHVPALLATLVISVAVTLALVAYVYLRDADLRHWQKWSGGAFLVGIVLSLVGSFVGLVLIAAFAFIFLGFILELGFEIWRVRAEFDPDAPLIHAVGIYVAFTGVFVHILQLVLRAMAER